MHRERAGPKRGYKVGERTQAIGALEDDQYKEGCWWGSYIPVIAASIYVYIYTRGSMGTTTVLYVLYCTVSYFTLSTIYHSLIFTYTFFYHFCILLSHLRFVLEAFEGGLNSRKNWENNRKWNFISANCVCMLRLPRWGMYIENCYACKVDMMVVVGGAHSLHLCWSVTEWR